MLSESATSRQYRTLQDGLAAAATRLRTAALRSTAVVAVERMAVTILTAGAVLAGAKLAGLLIGGSGLPIMLLAAGLVLPAIAVGAITMVPAWRRAVSPDAAAERLDLALGDHNVIATALNLARANDASPFAALAIERGLTALIRHGDRPPVVEVTALRHHRVWPTTLGGVLLASLALWLSNARAPLHAGAADPQFALARPVHSQPPTASPEPEKPQPRPEPQKNTAAANKTSANKKADATAADAQPTNADRPADAAAANTSDGGQAAAKSDRTAAPTSKKPEQPNRSAAPTDAPQPQSPAAAKSNASQQKSSLGQSDSDGKSSSNASPAASGSKSDSASGEKSGDKSSDSQNGGSSDSDSGPPPPGDEQGGQPQGGNQSSDNPNAPDAPGSGNGRSSMSSESGGGNGQSSGQSPPKKARGVAPLLLGTRQADVLQGKPLPGPDERTRIQLPPVRQPGEPDAAAAAPASNQPEPPTGVYRVPADRRAAVDAYFKQFHHDQAAPK